MLKKANTDKGKIEKWLNDHDGEERCNYCIYDDECPHGIRFTEAHLLNLRVLAENLRNFWI